MKKAHIILFFGFILVGLQAFGQSRYGHLNFGNLLSLMPATKVAEDSLNAYQQRLVTKGEAMAEALRTKYTAFVQKVQGGDLTPVQQQEQQTALQQEQQTLMAYEQEMQQMLEARRNELLNPIIEEAQAAIAAVSKTNNYILVFDTSVFNSVLFATDTDDLLVPVLNYLKIPIPDPAATPAKEE